MKPTESQFERNDPVFNDSYNLGLVSAEYGGPSIETLQTRHKVLGEERPISGSGLAQGAAEGRKLK